jgi:hypothetical protein
MSVKLSLESIFPELYEAERAGEQNIAIPPVPADEAGKGDSEPDAERAPLPSAQPVDTYEHATGVPYEVTVGAITQKLQAALDTSSQAAKYMAEQRRQAAGTDQAMLLRKDAAYGLSHRKTGLPTDPSHLHLDASTMATNGLMHPHALLASVLAERDRRSSVAPAAVSAADIAAGNGAPPHYAVETRSHERQTSHFAVVASIASVKQMRDAARSARGDTLAQTKAAFEETRRAEPGYDAAEAQAEGERERRRRADALKKPSPAVVERLVAASQAPQAFHRNPRFVNPTSHRLPVAEVLAVQPAAPTGRSLIHPSPQQLVFTEYQQGCVYELPLTLRNTDPACLTRRVRVLPPASPHFSVSLLSYPSGTGYLAAGMHAEVRVRFAPDSLADFDDFLVVQSEFDSFPVPLKARRRPPCLTLPASLDCGCCFVGGGATAHFDFVNQGGHGRFHLLDKHVWADGGRQPSEVLRVDARAGPGAPTVFQITPTFLDLPPGAAGRFSVAFAPDREGPVSHPLTLVCDNCKVQQLSVSGVGCAAAVRIESVDGRPPRFTTDGRALQETVDFGPVSVHARVSVVVALLNTTPLPFDFEWQRHVLPEAMLPLTRSRTAEPPPLSTVALPPPLGIASPDAFPFTISPASGTLVAGEIAEFTLTHAPLLPRMSVGALMLAARGVPAEALPGDEAGGGQLGLRLQGMGVSEDLILDPVALLAPGGAAVGVGLACAFTLRNPNQSERRWIWIPEGPGGLGGSSLEVKLDPSEGVLALGEEVHVTLTALGHTVGTLRRTLLFGVVPAGRTIQLPVEMTVHPPEVRLTPLNQRGQPHPILDFGLVPLGETRQLALRLANTTDAHAPWAVAPVAMPSSHAEDAPPSCNGKEAVPSLRGDAAWDAARAQAAALGQDVEASCFDLSLMQWGWADEGENPSAEVEAVLRAALSAAGLRLSHVAGVLPPHSEVELILTLDPAAAQSLRRTLACAIRTGGTRHVAVTAEVVQRRACLSQSVVDLGVCYVKVPERRLLSLTNLTHCATDFEFILPQLPGVHISVEPRAGTLSPNEERQLLLQVAADGDGARSMLLGCKIQGGAPIGLRVTLEVKGLTLSWEVLHPEDPRALVLPPPAEPHVPPATAGAPPPTLDFGRRVPIFEATTRVLLVTNHSAVPTTYRAAAQAFPAPLLGPDEALPPDANSFSLTASMAAAIRARERDHLRTEKRRARAISGSDETGSRASTVRSQSAGGVSRGTLPLGATAESVGREPAPSLGDAHERSQPFFSESGVNVAARKALQRREAALLSRGMGAAYEVLPAKGEIPAWGSALLAVVVHSNLWGQYDDVLDIDVERLPGFRARMVCGVVGCPVTLHDATLGLSMRTTPPTITWPPAPHCSAPTKKTIRLTNHGPAPAELRWGMYDPPDQGRRLSARLATRADGTVALRLDMASRVCAGEAGGEEAPLPCPFTVDPCMCTIPPDTQARFTVTFSPPAEGGESGCRLVAHLSHPTPVVRALGDLFAGEATPHHPPIELHLHAHTVTPQLLLSERAKLKFQVSPVWTADAPCYTRELVLRNGQSNTLRFSLQVPPPFVLQRVDTSCAQATRIKEIGVRSTVGEGSLLELPPRETLRATISFAPSRKRRARRRNGDGEAGGSETDRSDADETASVSASQAASHASAFTTGEGEASDSTAVAARNAPVEAAHAAIESRREVHAEMSISFENGTVQSFPLTAVICKPYIQLSRTDMERHTFKNAVDFGSHHVACPQAVELQVSNPSEADAHWSISHLPAHVPQGMTARRASELAAEYIDEPDVFVFSAREGDLGPKLGVIPPLHPLGVRFVAPKPGRYRSTFVLKVKAGMAVMLELSGESTLEEEYYDVQPNERHLSLMLPGVLS